MKPIALQDLLRLLTGSAGAVMLAAEPSLAGTYTVTSAADTGAAGTLRWAIEQANANAGADTITFTNDLGTITLTSALPIISDAVTINGGTGNTVSGNNQYRIFFLDASSVAINNLTLANGYAKGGNGGRSAGGGLGAGGAVFVNTGAVSLGNVNFANNTARGGNGGHGGLAGQSAGSGGGGLGGNGGDGGSGGQPGGGGSGGGGGGGFGGNGGSGGNASGTSVGGGAGGGGLIGDGGSVVSTIHGRYPDGADGGAIGDGEYLLPIPDPTGGRATGGGAGGTPSSPAGKDGSTNGGGGGGSSSFPSLPQDGSGGDGGRFGGGGGAGFLSLVANGGNGGEFGGGGGGSIGYNGSTYTLTRGGDGGFGGGGGSGNAPYTGTTSSEGGNGGFGGGGGAGTIAGGSGGAYGGAGGYAATPFTSTAGGGGGAGLGGAVFVRSDNGASLSVSGQESGSAVIAGSAGNTLSGVAAQNGQALGSAYFLPTGFTNFQGGSVSGVIDGVSGAGLRKSGDGTLVLMGANKYDGGTELAGGALVLGSAEAIGTTGTISFTGGTLQFSAANTTNYSSRFSTGYDQLYRLDTAGQNVSLGTALTSPGGSLTKLGTGTLTLTANNTYTGATVVGAGTLQIGNGGTTGTVAGSFEIQNAAQVVFNRSDALTYEGVITGQGGLSTSGSGTLTLKGGLFYQGPTNVSAGTLRLESKLYINGSLPGVLTVQSGAKLDLQVHDVFGNHTANPNARLVIEAGGLVTNGDVFNTFTNLTLNGGELRAAGGGSPTFTAYQLKGTVSVGGSSASSITSTGAANSQIQLGNNTASGFTTFQVADATGSSAADLVISADLQDGRDSGGAAVASGVAKTGAGLMVLAGNNTYSGTTTISSGTLQVGNGGTSGSITGNVTNNAALVFNRSDALTYGGTIGGTGSLTKLGSGTATLSGNHSYSGNTSVAAGTLRLGGATASSAFSIASGSVLELAPAADYGTSTTFSGSGTLRKSGTVSARWAGASATFALDSGSLIDVQGGTFVGGANGNEVWTNNKSDLNVAAGAEFNGVEANVRVDTLTGSGTIRSGFNGAGYTGFTFGVDNGSGTFAGGLADNPTSGVGAHYIKAGTGTQTLTGNNTHTGTTTLQGGTLALGSAGALGTTGVISFTGGTLQFSAANTTDYSSRFANASGQMYSIDTNGQNVTFASRVASPGGSLTKTGAGSLTLSGTTDNTALAVVVNGGSIVLAKDSSTNVHAIGGGAPAANLIVNSGGTARLGGTGGDQIYSGATVQVNLGGTFDLNGRSEGFAILAGFGTATNSLASTTGTLTLGEDNSSSALAARLVDGAGALALTKVGTGTLTLANNNTHTGGTTISAGTLQVGNGNTSGSITGNVANNAALVFNRSDDLTFGGSISGNGALTKLGAGTLTLAGNSIYTGATTISAGTLSLAGTLYNGGASAGAVWVKSGGILNLQNSHVLGAPTGVSQTRLTVETGGLVANGNFFNSLTDLTLNGGELRAAGGSSASNPAYQLKGTVTIGGSSASSITTTGAPNSQIHLGDNTAGGFTTFQVADVTGNGGSDLVVSADLQNSRNSTGAAVASGLVKTGEGTITLGGYNTFTGSTTVSAGTLRLAGGIYDAGRTAGVLTVQSGATLDLQAQDIFGNHVANRNARLVVEAGGLVTNGNFYNTLNGLTLNGGELRAAGGTSSTWTAYQLKGTVTVGGTTASAITTTGAPNSQIHLGNNTTGGFTTFRVADVTADSNSDLVISAVLQNGWSINTAPVATGLVKTGAGTLTLSGRNTYSDGTTITDGTIIAAHNQAVGSGIVTVEGGVFFVESGVTITNEVHLSGGSYLRSLGAGANLARAIDATSSFAAGRPDTTAKILQGTLSTPATLESSFQEHSAALNDTIRLSDVYSLHGTGDDLFVLQLSVTGLTADSYLGWLDTDINSATYGEWINAAEGNSGGTPTFFARGYNAATDFHLGYYGVDVATGTVWAVLDHNSLFAIVPEPGIGTLLMLGFGVLLFRGRGEVRKRRGRKTS